MDETIDRKADKKMPKIIGIDLGTTFSLVAEYNPVTKLVTVIPDESSGYTVASAVYYPENGEPVAGQEAINAGDYAGDRLIRFIKMNMGTDFRKKIGDRDYSPAEISAEILKKLKKNAETYLGVGANDFESIVITVPAYFTDAANNATLEAARIAGFDMSKVHLFPEPCAAAVAYVAEAGAELREASRLVAVSDLGGGTYDATIIETVPFAAPDGRPHLKVDIVSKEGNQNLGGVLWDDQLEEYVKAQCAAGAADGHSGAAWDDPNVAHGLRERVIRAKEGLSRTSPVKVPCCTGKYQEIDVATFERITANQLGEVEHVLRGVLESEKQRQEAQVEAGKRKKDEVRGPDMMLLAGGASHMPQVRRLVQEITGLEPRVHRNLEQIVAIGAAYEAAIITQKFVTHDGVVIQKSKSILTANVGIKARDPQTGVDGNAFILLKGDAEGEEKSREDLVVAEDNQAAVRFVLLEGMSEKVDECAFLGDAVLALPPGQPRGTRLKVILKLGENLTVEGKGIAYTSEGEREVPIRITRKRA
jgi:molecular chaperone DnaK